MVPGLGFKSFRWVVAGTVGLLLSACSLTSMSVSGEEPSAVPPNTAISAPTPTRTPALANEIFATPIADTATQSALMDIRERGAIRVGVLYNYPPLGFLTENGQVSGYEISLLRKMAEYWGIEVIPVQVTRQTRLSMLESGQVDVLAAAMPHRREYGEYVLFTDTTFAGGYKVLVRSDSPTDVLTALAAGRVAAISPEAAEIARQQAEGAGVSLEVATYDTPEAAIEAMLNDPAIGAVIGRRERLMLPDQTDDRVTLIDPFLLYEPYAFAVRRGDVPLRDLLNATFRKTVAAGEIGTVFSSSFFGIASDVFPERQGDIDVDLASFTADMPSGESVIDRIKRGEPLHVAGLDLSATPVAFDSQPIIDGYDRAVLNEMGRRWGIGIIELPDSAGPAGIAQISSGEADLVAGVRPDLSLAGQVELSQPYYQRGLRVIHMSDVFVLGIGDLEFKPALAVTPVDISQDLIEKNNRVPEVTIAGSYQEAFDALTARGVYAVVGDEYALTLMANADERIDIIDTRYRPTDYVMALPRFDADFLDLVNYTLQDMFVDGTLERLREQYFGPYLPDGSELEALTLEVWPGDSSYLGVGG